jgi:hypothetical protein
MSDNFPVTPAAYPTRNLKIGCGDSSGNGLLPAHQSVPHLVAAPAHPTIVPYTVCTDKAPGRARDIARRSGIGFQPGPGREAQMVNKPPAPAASISPAHRAPGEPLLTSGELTPRPVCRHGASPPSTTSCVTPSSSAGPPDRVATGPPQA